MPPRNPEFRLQDMLEAIDRILSYTADQSFPSFAGDQKTVDAVVRNLEVLGEAARHVDPATVARLPGVPWRDMADLRNLLIHHYFGVSLEIVWATIERDLRPLRDSLLSAIRADGAG